MFVSKVNKNLIIISLIVTIGGLLFGYNTGVVNGSLSFVEKDLMLTAFQKGWVSSALTLSAAFGAVFGGKISDNLGRKKTLRIIAWIYLVGAIGCSLSFNFSLLVFSRFLLGLAVGSSSAVVPLYLGEISSAERRGKMVGLNQVMIVGGQFLAFLLNAILGNAFIENNQIWKVMMGLAVVPAIIMIVGMTKVLESPKWFAKNGYTDKAIQAIKEIYKDDSVAMEKEIQELKDVVVIDKWQTQQDTKEKIPGWALKVLFLGCLLGVIQQFAGINSIMYYGSEILSMYGFGEGAALMFNVLNGVVSVIASLIGMNIVDNMGRKKLEIRGLAICAISLISVGVLSKLLAGTQAAPYTIMVVIFIYIFAFQGAVGPVTWILISEMFPAKYRGTFSGIAVFVLWIANFFVGLFFPVLVEIVGVNATFYGFAVCAIIGIVIIHFQIPETKGKTLEEIESHFTK
ncbi:hypothetical protein T233_01586 [Vagococcus lutrae LBD1]|uniref:Major facilitator superfamily (MFS) profile domain-containing protein n=1 Tax=Vagococcus lutrae LBD1 TaxID=1408226 RepID=V6Q9D3_9ENTE|nr:hypothetical protein T233_01586 [Vagococcus lutrae LBD1]